MCSATSATSRQSSAVRIHACSARRSTPAAEPGQSNALHRSGLRYRIVIPTPKQGSVLVVCVLCACAVRVGVCGERVFRIFKKKKKMCLLRLKGLVGLTLSRFNP